MRKSISSGLVGVAALSTVGNLIISLPLTANDGSDIISMLIAAAFSFILFLFFYPIVTDFFKDEKKGTKKAFRLIRVSVYLFLQAVLILICVITLCDFSKFSSSVVLPNVHIGFIFAALAVTAVIIGTKEAAALSKTATVFLAIAVALTAVIFLFSIPHMSFKYITPRDNFELSSTVKTALSFFFSSFAQSFILVSVFGGEVRDKKSALIGSAVGGLLIVLCTLNTLLVFGGEFSSELEYPYIAAVKTVGTGDVFSGMEGFLYVTVFLCCMLKTAVSVFGIKLLAKKILNAKNFQ